MDDLARFCCLNTSCPDHGLRGQANIAVRGYYGPNKARRLLYCKACQQRFPERQGTPLFHCHLPPDEAQAVPEHPQDGCGVRQTSRLVRVHQATVTRLGRLAGKHAKDAHDEVAGFSPLDHRGAAGREVVLRRQEGEAL
jgi:hypothetical protein